jgi:hypothetical protein
LADPSIANGATTVDVGAVPMLQFARNEAYDSAIGLTIQYHMENATSPDYGTFSDSEFWNDPQGIYLPYANQVALQNLLIVAPKSALSSPLAGIEINDITRNIIFNNLQVTGYQNGVEVPVTGTTLITGGYYDNIFDIEVKTARGKNRSVTVTGPITFGPTTIDQIAMVPQIAPLASFYNDVTHDFLPDRVILNYGTYANQQLYYTAQLPTYVPFPVAAASVPAAYVGLTNQQLHDQFGISIGGVIASPDAHVVPRVSGGLVGSPSP